jgi:hypothetical protein
LAPAQLVIAQQYLFNGFGVLSSRSDPVANRVLFVPTRPHQAADPIAFSNMGQGINNLSFRRTAAIKQRPFGFCKGLPAPLAFITLTTGFGFAKFDDMALLNALQPAVIWTDLIGAKVTDLS